MTLWSLFIVSVADQDRSKAFYTEKLGFQIRTDDESGDGRWFNCSRQVAVHDPADVVGASLEAGRAYRRCFPTR